MSTGTVGCQLVFDVGEPACLAVQVAVARRPGLDISDRLAVLNNGVPVTAQELSGADSGRQHLIRTGPGTLEISYAASISRSGVPVAETVGAAQRVAALRPSRYCPSDRMAGFARGHFGRLPTDRERVAAVHGYVWEHVGYEVDTSGAGTDAVDTLLGGRGVCRDFAHLVAALCRAVEVPARIAAAYAPGLSPMDFHAVVETAIEDRWYVWDATRLAPRPTLVRIATGRDATDTAFATVLSGRAELTGLEITAATPDDLPLDDHDGLVALG